MLPSTQKGSGDAAADGMSLLNAEEMLLWEWCGGKLAGAHWGLLRKSLGCYGSDVLEMIQIGLAGYLLRSVRLVLTNVCRYWITVRDNMHFTSVSQPSDLESVWPGAARTLCGYFSHPVLCLSVCQSVCQSACFLLLSQPLHLMSSLFLHDSCIFLLLTLFVFNFNSAHHI